MRRLGTDHLISGPMRGLKKAASVGANRQIHRQIDGYFDTMTESAQWGRLREKYFRELL